jgi:hypothetical protein
MKKFIVAAIAVAAIGLMGFDGCTIDLSRTNGNQKVDDTATTDTVE